MHPILNGYIAQEIIARKQADGDAWRHSRTAAAEDQPEADAHSPSPALGAAPLHRLLVDDHVRRGLQREHVARAHQARVLAEEELEAVVPVRPLRRLRGRQLGVVRLWRGCAAHRWVRELVVDALLQPARCRSRPCCSRSRGPARGTTASRSVTIVLGELVHDQQLLRQLARAHEAGEVGGDLVHRRGVGGADLACPARRPGGVFHSGSSARPTSGCTGRARAPAPPP